MTTTMTRRTLLRLGAATTATAAAHAGLTSAAAASGQRRLSVGRGRLVTVFLRGGQDHLSVAFPVDDAHLHDARPTIAVDDAAALAIPGPEGNWGLHPSLGGLHAKVRTGSAAIVVAAGNPAGDRSHFVAQDLAALGAETVGHDGRGWLARHLLATTTADDTPLRALTMGGNVDRSLAGFPALGLASISQFGLHAGDRSEDLAALLREVHAGTTTLDDTAHRALDAAATVAGLEASSDPDPVARAFADAASLLEADVGVEVLTVDLGGWDTHDRMGTTTDGTMAGLLAGLDRRLCDFHADLLARGIDDVTIVVLTEFGRRVAENGSGGTDHGWGSAMVVLGAGVVGGIHGDWPGLDPADLPRGDVPVTTDFRDVLAEVAGDRLGLDPAVAFPGHHTTPVGVIDPKN